MKTYREFNQEQNERIEKLSARIKRAKAMRKNKENWSKDKK